jgi:hypothetical protein
MKREGVCHIIVKPKRFNELPEYAKKHYNKIVKTNKTIKQPYYCPKGKKHCLLCSKPSKSAKNKNLDLRDIMVEIVRDPYDWNNWL